MPALRRVSAGLLALLCLCALALGALALWRAHRHPGTPDLAGAVLVSAPLRHAPHPGRAL